MHSVLLFVSGVLLLPALALGFDLHQECISKHGLYYDIVPSSTGYMMAEAASSSTTHLDGWLMNQAVIGDETR